MMIIIIIIYTGIIIKIIFSAFYSMNGLVLILRDEHGKT